MSPGAPRILPGGEFETLRSIRTVRQNGQTFRVTWDDGIPYVCCRSESHSTAFVTLASKHISRKVLKRFRKRARKEVEYEEGGADDDFVVPVLHAPSDGESAHESSPGSAGGEALDFSCLFSGMSGFGSERWKRLLQVEFLSNRALQLSSSTTF